MRGRRPIPTHLRIVRGNPGRRPINDREPKPEIKAPEPPALLKDVALAHWHKMAPLLQRMGVLSEADGDVLAAYCVAYARWVDAEQRVASFGAIMKHPVTGALMHNVFLSVANNAMGQMERLGDRLGLSPSARARLSVDVPKPVGKHKFFDD